MISPPDRTFRRWREDPQFDETVRQRRRALMGVVEARFKALAAKATDVVEELLHSERDWIRLKTCELVLRTATALYAEEIESRLSALEQSENDKENAYAP
jgi:hypothetical protein